MAEMQGSPSPRQGGINPTPAAPCPYPDDALPEAFARLSERLGSGALLGTSSYRGEATALVPAGQVVEIVRFLRDEAGLEYVMLIDLCATHWMDREFSYEVVYLLHSFVRNDRVRLKVRLGEEGRVSTMTGVHTGADWQEREAYDLVGVVFEGHPDLRRILMPEDYDVHPLRKDFPVKGY
jgi:NADH-quinone oxidoreductase subunit C